MTNVFKPKRSSTPSSIPTTSNLVDGELAINSADKVIYIRDGESVIAVANYSTESGGGGISNIVEDTTPQLGGDLDLNGSDITGTGNIDISGTLTAESTTQTLTLDINQSSGTFTGNVVDVGYVDSTLGRRSIFQIAAQSFRYDTTTRQQKLHLDLDRLLLILGGLDYIMELIQIQLFTKPVYPLQLEYLV